MARSRSVKASADSSANIGFEAKLNDVLWLKGNSIVAAFEVECTTAVYSGLLGMSGFSPCQPNDEC